MVSRAEQLFHEALELPAGERSDFLERTCGGDRALHDDVTALLQADSSTTSWIDGTALRLLRVEAAPPRSLEGCRVGAYDVVRILASGGSSTVYEAVQSGPSRPVALKVLNLAIASPAMMRRFEHEAEILAALRHPAIAQVYDAGTHTVAGQHIPYFALELIPGAQPLTDHARQQRLGVVDRLQLFRTVCDAVHHGHQKGIIHRDLKPGNILVGSDGHVHVIDFGVARVTSAGNTPLTRTADHQVIGTLQYMSPEQCDPATADLDIRSDIYSLGIVLHELVYDRPPYELRGKTLVEAAQIIQGVARPSASVLDRRVAGDLRIIIGKALARDREMRYAAASELGQDIQRFVDGEPILARPASTIYQLRKIVSRHRLSCALVVTLGVVIGLGAVALTLQAREVRAQRDQAESVSTFLRTMLSSASPVRPGEELTLRQLLDDAARRVDGATTDQPLVEAALRKTIGETYRALGVWDAADTHLRRAVQLLEHELGGDALAVADARNSLGRLYTDTDRWDEAAALLEQALAGRRRHLGDLDSDVANSMGDVVLLHLARHDYAAAEPLAREAVRLTRAIHGNTHLDTANALNNLALVVSRLHYMDEAVDLYEQAMVIKSALLGDDHVELVTTANNLAGTLMRMGYPQRALPYYRQAAETLRRIHGPDHPDVGTVVDNLGALLIDMQQYESAENALRDALRIREAAFDANHTHVAASLYNLGRLLLVTGRPAEAEPLLRRAVAIRAHHHGADGPFVAQAQVRWAAAFMRTGHAAEVEAVLLTAHERLAHAGAPSAELFTVREFLAECYDRLGDARAAAVWRAADE